MALQIDTEQSLTALSVAATVDNWSDAVGLVILRNFTLNFDADVLNAYVTCPSSITYCFIITIYIFYLTHIDSAQAQAFGNVLLNITSGEPLDFVANVTYDLCADSNTPTINLQGSLTRPAVIGGFSLSQLRVSVGAYGSCMF